MKGFISRFLESPRCFRRLMNLWPPFLGAGITVRKIASDWREIDVSMRLRWYNRNYMGTHFGGSLYAMTDPFYVLMLIRNLRGNYLVWDMDAQVRFLRPGRGTVVARFLLSEETLVRIREATGGGRKALEPFTVQIHDEDGKCVAEVQRTVYIRMKKRP